jgi:DNA-binding winged helix-turn-helix (wHTH) protein
MNAPEHAPEDIYSKLRYELWTIGNFTFNTRSCRLKCDGRKEARLGEPQAKLLALLIFHFPDRKDNNREIAYEIWGDNPNNEEKLYKTVQLLRKAFGGDKEEYIATGPFRLVKRPEPILGTDTAPSSVATIPLATGIEASEQFPEYDLGFAHLATLSRAPAIKELPGFGWGTALSLQDAPDYAGWQISAVELQWERQPFQLDQQLHDRYQQYFKEFYMKKRFNEDNDKFMLIENPIAFSDAPSLVLNVKPCKYSEVQFYRDNIATSSRRDALIEELVIGSLRADFPHSLCMHAVIITADHKLLRTRRSPKVAYYAGAWSCSVEENLAASDLKADEKSRILALGMRLLDEELHLTEQASTPEKMWLLSVFLESDILNISLCSEITLTLSSSELDTALRGFRRKDTEFTQWDYLELEKDVLLREIIHPNLEYHPTSQYRLVQVLLKHFGTPSQADIAKIQSV